MLKIAAVSYLNTAPLIEGLDVWAGCELVRSVPAGIGGMVARGEADLGLASVVDYAKYGECDGGGLVMVPAGMIGCDGPTLTVRLFSSVPIEEISVVHADTDSHTSVVLCDLVLRERGVNAKIVDFDVRERVASGGEAGSIDPDSDGWPEAVLMIGDKVVTGSPAAVRYPYQVDLGEAWGEMTGLPFVYAVWMCRADRVGDEEIGAGALVLERMMLRNRLRLDWIVMNHAKHSGWPADLARRYIGELLRFEVDDRAREAVGVFLERAAGAGLVDRVETKWMELGERMGVNEEGASCLH
jgi:chorismate dehydratase